MPDVLLLLARTGHTAFTIALIGLWSFRALLAPVAMPRFATIASAGVPVSAGLWLSAQAASLTESSIADAIAAVPDVALHTRFGNALLAGTLLIAVACLIARRAGRGRAGLAAALATTGLLARLASGHAAALQDTPLLVVQAVHVAAAALWLGMLPPLWAALGQHQGDARLIVGRFSRIGLGAVIALAVTGFAQALSLIGDVPALLGTRYGQVTLAKVALFIAILGVAVWNRVVLTPALPASICRLRRSIVAETFTGLLIVAVAALIGMLPPGIHIQPDWPLPFRITLPEPEGAGEAEGSGMGAAIGLALLAVTVVAAAVLCWRRRVRWAGLLAIAGAAAAAFLLLPPIQLQPATQASFRTMPEGFTVAGILRGQDIAAAGCTGCDAILQRLLDPGRGRLTDGELYKTIRNGFEGIVPARGEPLPDAEAWDLAAYLRTRAAGIELDRDGGWSGRLAAPDMPLRCAGELRNLSGLRGRVLRVAAGYAPPVEGALTVNLDPDRATASECAALSDTARRAYSLIVNASPDALTGYWFLVDGNGWLRGTGRGFPDILTEAIRAVAVTPLSEERAHH